MSEHLDREPVNKELLERTAREMGLPIKTVKDIVVNGQSKFTAHIMKAGAFESVRWPYIGVFKAKVNIARILTYMKGLTLEQKKFFKDQYKLKKNREKAAKQKKTKQ